MKYYLPIVLASLVLAAADKEDLDKLKSTLMTQEKEIWEAVKKKDADAMKALLPDDYLETSAAGRRNKTEVLKNLSVSEMVGYTMQDEKVVQLNKETAILTYKFTVKLKEGPQNPQYSSSIYLKRGDKWVQVFFQETAAAEGE